MRVNGGLPIGFPARESDALLAMLGSPGHVFVLSSIQSTNASAIAAVLVEAGALELVA